MAKRLDALRKKQAQIAAQIKDAENRERRQKRKDDDRRKIIAGALALHHAQANPSSDFARKVSALLNEYVTRPKERALFDLPPLPQDAEQKARPD